MTITINIDTIYCLTLNMKIAFIGQKGIPAQTGGVERHVGFLVRELNKLGHEIIVYNRRGYTPVHLREIDGVRLIYKGYINNKNLASITHTFLATLDVIRRRVDIIHYHGIGPSLLLWMPKIFCPKTKIIATLHSFDYDNEKWSPFAKFMLRLGEKVMLATADGVIVLTKETHDYILKKYGSETFIIPNGTELGPVETDSILKFWGLMPNKYILSVSRLIKLKGIQYLISAFKHLPTDMKLVVVGNGEYEEELRLIADNDRRIIFVGNQSGDALRQLYSHAFLFVQSSEMEGMSLSLLEAMGHGCPCLVSDINGNRTALENTGYYFRSKDINDLEIQLKNIIDKPDETVKKGRAAFERAAKEFDWGQVAAKTENVYNTVLNRVNK